MYKYIQRIEHMKTTHLGAQHVLHVIIIFYNSRTMILIIALKNFKTTCFQIIMRTFSSKPKQKKSTFFNSCVYHLIT